MSVTEQPVASANELQDGQMKQVTVGETSILLCKVEGDYYALGAKCTHYGAPLADGVLHGTQVFCPWHQAGFDVTNGDNNQPPAYDALPTFPVHEKDGKIIVKVPDDAPGRRTMNMSHFNVQSDTRDFVILGAGAAGEAAAETLRQQGFEGHIFLITKESQTPYDRPNLSKEYLSGDAPEEWMPLRGEEFYKKYDIDLTRNRLVREIDIKKQVISFGDSATQHYDELLVATGGIARTLNVPGKDLDNVFTLRSFDDADRIIEKVGKGKKAVIIGASFIGLETATSLRKRELDVHVVAPENVPYQRVFGEEIGNWIRKKHEDNGIRFSLGTSVTKLKGDDGTVTGVTLSNGKTLDADIVLVGIGVRPNTDFIKGLSLHNDGGIKVDRYLMAADHIYAAGDIAWFPYWRNDQPVRIEHWRLAQQHGRIAAHNMLGKQVPYKSIPFFWTSQSNATLNYLGYAKDWDDLIIDGNIKNDDFMAYYVKNNEIAAVVTPNREKQLAAIHHLMILDRMPGSAKVRDHAFDPIEALKEA
ncbi:MAG TPA: FAD-dependent oxidoreductase [Balneolales bacterium]|nr:FAD-dependent oxidoreductase [Balneolales bacterium]